LQRSLQKGFQGCSLVHSTGLPQVGHLTVLVIAQNFDSWVKLVETLKSATA